MYALAISAAIFSEISSLREMRQVKKAKREKDFEWTLKRLNM